MDLWQLQIFCKVVELKSFSKAGNAIHLSQPTVSNHIKDLEDHFGCRLIDRLAREAVPTRAGELLYRYARRLIALRAETDTAMAEFKGKMKGRLVIGGSTIPGGYLLPRIVGDFNRHFPDVMVSLVIGDSKKIVNDTLDGAIELGVVGAVAAKKNLVQEKLLEDQLLLIVPPEHPWSAQKSIALSDLLSEPFIIRETGSGTLQSFQQMLAELGYDLDDLAIIAEMGSTESIRQAVKCGVGISVLSSLAVAEDLAAGSVKSIEVAGLNLKRNFYLTYHKYRSPSPLNETFIQFLKKELQNPL
jgi:DNA-binding transcriptional LysR family regulator